MTNMSAAHGVERRDFGLFVMEDQIGHRTVYENMRTAAGGTRATVALVALGERRGLARLPTPALIGRLAEGLNARQDVGRLIRRVRPDYLISNTHKPVQLSHDLVSRVPTAIMLDATPRQFDRLEYGKDPTDRLLGISQVKYLLVRSLFRRARALLPWSTWAAHSLVEEYGVPRENIVVIPPGIDTDTWSPSDKPVRARPEIIFRRRRL